MKLKDSKDNYIPLVIPISKPFEELNKKEAKEYFDWFLSHIDERADYIREKVSLGLELAIETLDFSFESLKPIWKWFLQVAAVSKTPKNELKKIKETLEQAGQPKSFINHMIEQSKEELSVFTEYVIRDIGMYLSKVFLQNYSQLKWTMRTSPKSYVYINEPIIIGFIDNAPSYPKPFHPDLEPIDLVRTPAMNLFDGSCKEDDLYDWSLKWVQWIPK